METVHVILVASGPSLRTRGIMIPVGVCLMDRESGRPPQGTKQEAAREKLLKEVVDRERQREEKERVLEESQADKLLVESLP